MKKSVGFTLIELLIAIAIVGVLSSIAYPSYKEYVAKGRRAEAKASLLSAQQWMERFYTENFRYDRNAAGISASHASQFPSRFSVVPPAGDGAPFYDIVLSITANVRDVYKISAIRRQGSPMGGDRCGDYSLDHLGRRSVENFSGFSDAAAARSFCWK